MKLKVLQEYNLNRGRRGRHRMVVGFPTICGISLNHH